MKAFEEKVNSIIIAGIYGEQNPKKLTKVLDFSKFTFFNAELLSTPDTKILRIFVLEYKNIWGQNQMDSN